MNSLILGIESSCDETAAALVDHAHCVRSSVVASQHDLHQEFGGVVPEIASRAHLERSLPVLRSTLKGAGVQWSDIEAVAVGHRQPRPSPRVKSSVVLRRTQIVAIEDFERSSIGR